MTQRTTAKISGIGSIFVGLVVLFFYFRGILPLTDVYVAKREFGYYLVYLVAAAAGVLLLAAAIKRKKPVLWTGAGLLLLGIPLFFYAVGRLPFDYAPIRLRMIGRGLIPAAFIFLGIFALRGFRWTRGIPPGRFLGPGALPSFSGHQVDCRGGGRLQRRESGRHRRRRGGFRRFAVPGLGVPQGARAQSVAFPLIYSYSSRQAISLFRTWICVRPSSTCRRGRRSGRSSARPGS